MATVDSFVSLNSHNEKLRLLEVSMTYCSTLTGWKPISIQCDGIKKLGNRRNYQVNGSDWQMYPEWEQQFIDNVFNIW